MPPSLGSESDLLQSGPPSLRHSFRCRRRFPAASASLAAAWYVPNTPLAQQMVCPSSATRSCGPLGPEPWQWAWSPCPSWSDSHLQEQGVVVQTMCQCIRSITWHSFSNPEQPRWLECPKYQGNPTHPGYPEELTEYPLCDEGWQATRF